MPTNNEKLTREITAQAELFDEIFANNDPFDELLEGLLVVVLCAGGPHVEAAADLDADGAVVSASLVGYWGRETTQAQVKASSSLWRALREYAETLRMSV